MDDATDPRNYFQDLPLMLFRAQVYPTLKVEYISAGVYKILGYTPQEVCSNPQLSFDLVHPEDLSLYNRMLNGEIPEKVYLRWKRKDGEYIWLDVIQHNYYDVDGRLVAYEGLARDISELVKQEMALRLESTMHNYAAELSKTGAWEWDVENLKMSWTPECYKVHDLEIGMFADDSQRLIQHSFMCYSERDQQDLEIIFDRCLNQGIGYDLEFPFTTHKGTQKWIRIAGKPLSKDGKVYKIVGTMVDITDRKEIELHLQDSRDSFSKLIDNLPIGIAVHSANGKVSYANSSACEMLGLSQDQIKGIAAIDPCWRFHREDGSVMPLEEYPVNSVLRTKTPFSGMIVGVYIPELDETHWGLCNGLPLFDRSGKISEIVIGFVDISSNRQTQAKLNQESSLRQILMDISTKYINLPIEMVDAEIAASLEKMAKFVGADRCYIFDFDAITGLCSNTYEWCEVGIKPEVTELQNVPLASEWIEAFARQEAMNIPCVDDLPEGLSKQTLQPQGIKSLLSLPMIDQGLCVGFVGFDSVKKKHRYTETEIQLLRVYTEMVLNVKKRQESTRALVMAKEKAQESDRLKTAFLANISHEIRTPMNGIMGFTNLLKTVEFNEAERKEYLGLIYNSSMRLLNMVNDIIDVSKIEAGALSVRTTTVYISETLQKIYAFFADEAKRKGLILVLENSIPDGNDVIYTDSNKLEAILSNLVKNAIKFSAKGKISICARMAEDQVELSVQDEGIGIAQDMQQQIFERFIQVEMGNTRDYEGAGLGLSIAKSYAELLGGKISLCSKLGEGSTFSVILPVRI